MKSLLLRMRLTYLRRRINGWDRHVDRRVRAASVSELRVLLEDQARRRSEEKVLRAKLGVMQ